MTTFIAIVSSKGGAGRTTAAINLASALTAFSRKTIVVDCHLQKPNVGLYLGYTHVPKNATAALDGKHKLSEAIYLHPSGIHVVPADMSIEAIRKKFDREHIANTMTDLLYKAEVVLVDTPTDFDEMEKVVHACDAVIYISEPEMVSLTEILKTKSLIAHLRKRDLGVIISANNNHNFDITHADIESMLNLPIIGDIPYDTQLLHAQSKKYPVVYANTDAASTIAYKKLAANLIGEPFEHNLEANESFWSYLLMRLGFRDPK